MIRVPGCNHDPATTVLAHKRLAGYSGTALKPDDFVFGAWACSHCHDVVDGRKRVDGFSYDDARQAHSDGIHRTQMALIGEGVVTIT